VDEGNDRLRYGGEGGRRSLERAEESNRQQGSVPLDSGIQVLMFNVRSGCTRVYLVCGAPTCPPFLWYYLHGHHLLGQYHTHTTCLFVSYAIYRYIREYCRFLYLHLSD